MPGKRFSLSVPTALRDNTRQSNALKISLCGGGLLTESLPQLEVNLMASDKLLKRKLNEIVIVSLLLMFSKLFLEIPSL